jgi:Major Facilitator Superfamily
LLSPIRAKVKLYSKGSISSNSNMRAPCLTGRPSSVYSCLIEITGSRVLKSKRTRYRLIFSVWRQLGKHGSSRETKYGRLRFAGQSSLDDQPGILARSRAIRPEGMRPMTSVPIQGEAKAPSKFWVLLTAALVSSLIMLDPNIVAVSLPAIGRSLGASFSDVQWVISAYVLTYASLLLASGGYAGLSGRKKSMFIGLVIFAVAKMIDCRDPL